VLADHGIHEKCFALVKKLCSHYSIAAHSDAMARRAEGEREGGSSQERLVPLRCRLGVLCKRVLNELRADMLRRSGVFRAVELVEFCDAELSLENTLLVATC
jgi:hypothetical protein